MPNYFGPRQDIGFGSNLPGMRRPQQPTTQYDRRTRRGELGELGRMLAGPAEPAGPAEIQTPRVRGPELADQVGGGGVGIGNIMRGANAGTVARAGAMPRPMQMMAQRGGTPDEVDPNLIRASQALKMTQKAGQMGQKALDSPRGPSFDLSQMGGFNLMGAEALPAMDPAAFNFYADAGSSALDPSNYSVSDLGSGGGMTGANMAGSVAGGAGALLGGLSMGQGIASGDVGKAVMGGLGTVGGVGTMAAQGALGGGAQAAMNSIGGAGAVAGGLGAVTGLYNLYRGIDEGNAAGAASGAVGAASGGVGLAASGALGGAAQGAVAGASGPMLGVAGPVAVALIAAMRAYEKDQEQKFNQKREQAYMVRDAQVSAPKVAAGTQAVSRYLGSGAGLGGLREYANVAANALVNAPNLSHLVETKGQGGKATKPVDTDWLTRTVDYGDGRTDPYHKHATAMSTANLIRLQDALAKSGDPITTDATDLNRMAGFLFPERDPNTYRNLGRGDGMFGDDSGREFTAQDMLHERYTPEAMTNALNQGFYAGNMEQAILDHYDRTDPAAAAHWRQIFAGVQQIPVDLSPEEIERNLAGVRGRSAAELSQRPTRGMFAAVPHNYGRPGPNHTDHLNF